MASTNTGDCCLSFKIKTYNIAESLFPQHLLDHLVVLGHRMPGHVGPLGDSTVIGLIGTKPHVLPDLPLLFGEFLRRYDTPHPVLDGLPLGIQLLDEHLQLLLTHFTSMSIDAFGVLGAVRPGGRVTALKEVVVEFCDAAGSRLAGAPHDRLEVSERICLRRVLRHLIAQAPIDFGGGFAEHIASDVRINVQRCSRRHMAQHGGECLDVHAVFQCHGGESMAQIRQMFINTKTERYKKPGSHRKKEFL